MDDRAIIALFFQRSEDALTVTQEKYGKLCHTIAENLLHSREDAEECVNDTWHSLWNAIPPEQPENLCAYIARITRNLALKRLTYRNALKRRAVTVSFDELRECIPDYATPEAVLEGKELSRAIDAFLDTLDAESRNLFLRRYWFFDSTKTLSQSFHMSQSKVKVKLFRIRKQLKNFLEQEVGIYVG